MKVVVYKTLAYGAQQIESNVTENALSVAKQKHKMKN